MLLSTNDKYILATLQGVTAQELCFPQEEADIKLIAHPYSYFES